MQSVAGRGLRFVLNGRPRPAYLTPRIVRAWNNLVKLCAILNLHSDPRTQAIMEAVQTSKVYILVIDYENFFVLGSDTLEPGIRQSAMPNTCEA